MSRRINVLRVITWLPVGGIERRLVAILPRLDREKFNVQLVCIRERGALADELEAAGIKVHLVPFAKRWDLAALRRLAGLMREERTDIVHSHMYRSNVPAAVAGHMAGVRSVWGQVHNVDTWETRRQAWTDRWLCRWRTGMIAVSETVKRDVMANLRLPLEKVRVIYNGVDLARFRAARLRREEVRAREGAAPGDVVFLFAARLVEQKRCEDFIDAFGRIQRRAHGEARSRLKAWVLGDGPLRYKLASQAASSLAEPSALAFFGQRSDIEDFYAAADVFVLPSTKEGFSNALIEAMATGVACVATDVGGNAEAIRDGEDGIIVPPLAPDRLTAAMSGLTEDANRRAMLASAAAERAEAFSIERMIGEVESLYGEATIRASD